MSDTPEKIWAWTYHDDDESRVDVGEWYTERGYDRDETPYIRADIHEALEAKLALVTAERNHANDIADVAIKKVRELESTVQALVVLIKEARSVLEAYVTHEYPKDKNPYYERQWNRDMELCRRIDAALAAMKGQGDE